jgi:hypothetical protein
MKKGNSMRTFILNVALLASLAAPPACAQDAAKPTPDDLQTVVVTSSPVPELGVPRPVAQPNADDIKYESILNVDDLPLPADDGARWPSTTWVLYLR